MTTDTLTTTAATGPRTNEGKRIAARNATTHGLFARDVVLPHLGEDPNAYQAFLEELTAQIMPTSLLEQHYTEKIAAASWRLRRLHRWQAQVLEDPDLSDDTALLQLDRVLRHETTLHRQIDTSVRMMGRDVPHMTEGRARRRALAEYHTTELECRRDDASDWAVTEKARQYLTPRPFPPSLDPAALDTANCQNELAPAHSSPCSEGEAGRGCSSPWQGEVARNEPEGVLAPELTQANCQNEPAPELVRLPIIGAGGRLEAGEHSSHPLPEGPSRAPVFEVRGPAHSEGSLPRLPCPIVNLDDLGLQPGHPAFGLLFASHLRL